MTVTTPSAEDGRRPWTADVVEGTRTTMTVKRSCNGCGRQLGDATKTELLHAVAGLPLPDVRDECGCRVGPCETAI